MLLPAALPVLGSRCPFCKNKRTMVSDSRMVVCVLKVPLRFALNVYAMHATKNLLFFSDIASNDFFQSHFASDNSNPHVSGRARKYSNPVKVCWPKYNPNIARSCSIPLLASLCLRSCFCRLRETLLLYRCRVGVALRNARLSHWLAMFNKRLALALPLVMGETPA